MHISLALHIFIHISLSILAGLIVGRVFKQYRLSVGVALVSGFLVDFDHFIDYFLAFGASFNLNYFIKGYQFLKSDKLYIIFHGWEYAVFFLFLAIVFKRKLKKAIFGGLALGLLFHLSADVIIDQVPPVTYSLIYRAKNNFQMEKLITPQSWQEHMERKEKFKF